MNISLPIIAAQVGALKTAMDTVSEGNTPDHGKWGSVNSFAIRYNEIAGEYMKLTGQTYLKIYNKQNLKNPNDMIWPDQKALFDMVLTDVIILQNLTKITEISNQPIYNLFISGNEESWLGDPFQIELSRCIREYTNPSLTTRFGSLDASAISLLKKAPCIFGYESGIKLPPKFGYLRDIASRQGQVRLVYEVLEVHPFLSQELMTMMAFELDISKLELFRTHWAVKEVNLPKELHAKGIMLPVSINDVSNDVDLDKQVFDVALSFPGESRTLVEEVAKELERRLGPNRYFYDNNYISQLAQPSLDSLLQGVYRRALLDVVFVGPNYDKRKWCGVEFRAIKEIMFDREHKRIMFIRTEDGEVDGVFKTDGYIDARNFSASEIAEFICQRVKLLSVNREHSEILKAQ